MKKLFNILLHRVTIAALLIVLQLAVLVMMVMRFQNYFAHFYGICELLSLVVVLYIISSKSNPAYKIAWLIPILLFPIFGCIFYMLFGGNRLTRKERRKMREIGERTAQALKREESALDEIRRLDEEAGLQSSYIYKAAYAVPHGHTYTEFLPLGEVKFQRMLEELNKAKHYIFMEYFIIEEGKMWDPILEILKRKVQEGLDVRVMYDDAGCLMTLPQGYERKLEAAGIQCCVFNPLTPMLSLRYNNRDHRKICVIDGHTGFTGGINLADEYINAYPKLGHWKDCAIMLKGDAVWNLTVMFLTLWDYVRNIQEDYAPFRPDVYLDGKFPTDGFVQPFTDSPLDGEAVGETVYMNLINRAKRYVYINTPYLILDNEMVTSLSTAAKCGVDVRITTPHVPDKWYVHAVTRSNYEALLEAGVKIYEYTPGFVHAKTFAVDDEYGVVGTINLDYRSLYLHFECAAWLYRCSCIKDIRDDYLKTLEVCQEVTLDRFKNISFPRWLGRAVLRVFAPLM